MTRKKQKKGLGFVVIAVMVAIGFITVISSPSAAIGSEKGTLDKYTMKLSEPYHLVNVDAQGRYEITVDLLNDLGDDVELSVKPCCGTSVAFPEGKKLEKGEILPITITVFKDKTTIEMTLKGTQKEYNTQLVLKRVIEQKAN